jgi:hypothetical protein
MILLIIAILAIAGLMITTGLISFHLITIFGQSKNLLVHIGISILLSILIIGIGSILPLKSIVDSPEKHYIFYSIIVNYILMVWFLFHVIKRKVEYFPKQNHSLKKTNVLAVVLYSITLVIYLLFSFYGLLVGWQVITS